MAELTTCIRTNLDCADICATAGAVLTRQIGTNTAVVESILEACAAASKTCAEERGEHAQRHDHCLLRAEASRRCERSCQELLTCLRQGSTR